MCLLLGMIACRCGLMVFENGETATEWGREGEEMLIWVCVSLPVLKHVIHSV